MTIGWRFIAAATAGLSVVGLLIAVTAPIPQDPTYHAFADTRRILFVPNFWNVVSNLPFLIVGIRGLLLVTRMDGRHAESRAIFGVFFVGVAMTAFGSAYYHLVPANQPLVWDRLPMTVAIAGIFAIAISELVSPVLARRLLVPILIAGALSVMYWHFTELRNVGDLRPYAIVQFLPIFIVLIMLVRRGFASDLTPSLWIMLCFYIAAKIFEHFDAEIYALLTISGHTLKHLFAAAGPAAVVIGLQRRCRNQATPR